MIWTPEIFPKNKKLVDGFGYTIPNVFSFNDETYEVEVFETNERGTFDGVEYVNGGMPTVKIICPDAKIVDK